MSGLFANLVFLNPWILAGLLALPALWFLLRIMPPSPKRVMLPSVRFLEGLVPEQQTPSKTPWWILLLRLLIAALVFLALAQPVMNLSDDLPGGGVVRIVIDNGWASGETWDLQMEAAEKILSQAAREKRSVTIFTTALPAGQKTWPEPQMQDAAKAKGTLSALEPLPWPEDYEAAAAFIADYDEARGETMVSFWFSHGLDGAGIRSFAEALDEAGDVYYYAPEPERLPVALKRPSNMQNDEIGVALNAPSSVPKGTPYSLQAVNERGQVLDQKVIHYAASNDELVARFDIENAAQGQISEFRILGQNSAAAMLFLDEYSRKRSVGIIGPDADTATKPFIEARYYLTRALEETTSLSFGSAGQILEDEPSVIVMPDIASLPMEDLNALEEWVENGGVLLRFAGPNTVQSDLANILVPVPLRLGSRSMEGSLTWDEPVGLAAFPAQSPLTGISISPDIKVNTQILAQPNEELESKVWAKLEDGTPLITAAAEGRGLLVFIHTTASPLWSDLALSGTYVEMLKRIVALSGNVQNVSNLGEGLLQPVWVLDGFGRRIEPPASVKGIASADFDATVIGSTHPPGLYGLNGFQKALNLGEKLPPLRSANMSRSPVVQVDYGTTVEQDFMPKLLSIALALLLVDWAVMIAVSGALDRFKMPRFMRGVKAAVFAVLLFTNLTSGVLAQNNSADLNYADGLYLAYIKTGDVNLDALSQRGLDNLVSVLNRRTSVEPLGATGLDIEKDDLVFFPFIYWPVSGSPREISSEALRKVQFYLDHGGTILFDTRDGNSSDGEATIIQSSSTKNLRQMIGGLNIPALQPVNGEHVLGKSFYLLDRFPGRHAAGILWVEQQSLNGGEAVSSVLIGSNDWAGEWANTTNRTRQHELSMRFGVNVVMYALTGNYKADQVHLPHILERLGQ